MLKKFAACRSLLVLRQRCPGTDIGTGHAAGDAAAEPPPDR